MSSTSEIRLKRRYEDLRDLRETQPEGEVKRLNTVLEQTRRVGEERVKALKEVDKRDTPGLSKGADNSGTNGTVEDLEQKLRVFEMLTGMRVNLDAGGNLAHCSLGASEPEQLSFTLDLAPVDCDPGDVAYEPAGGDMTHLPEYLQEGGIIFGKEDAVPFMHKILSAMVTTGSSEDA